MQDIDLDFSGGAVTKGKTKHVLFRLGVETYALSILQIQEVISDFEITTLPKLPDFYSGIVNLRGHPIPVINLRRRFGLPVQERDKRTRIIIVELEPDPIGIQVDEVLRVVAIGQEAIAPPPKLTCEQKADFVAGLVDAGKKMIVLLDMRQILQSLEPIDMAELRKTLRDAYTASQSES